MRNTYQIAHHSFDVTWRIYAHETDGKVSFYQVYQDGGEGQFYHISQATPQFLADAPTEVQAWAKDVIEQFEGNL